MIYGQALVNEIPTHFPHFWLCNRNANIIKKVWFTSTSDGVNSKNITRKLDMHMIINWS